MIASDYFYDDPELGRFHIHLSPRAKRLTFRVKEHEIWVTIPAWATVPEVKRAIDDLRPRLRDMMAAQARPPILPGYRIDAPYLHLAVVKEQTTRFLLRRNGDDFQIVCPPDTDFNQTKLQDWLRRAIVEVMRRRAKEVLPQRLATLAQAHGLRYNQAKISSSTSRWGSCSSGGNINLSLYLVLLPLHLIDYVLLHELSHTREMNHSPRFWALLDQFTGGKAHALRDELKRYRCSL